MASLSNFVEYLWEYVNETHCVYLSLLCWGTSLWRVSIRLVKWVTRKLSLDQSEFEISQFTVCSIICMWIAASMFFSFSLFTLHYLCSFINSLKVLIYVIKFQTFKLAVKSKTHWDEYRWSQVIRLSQIFCAINEICFISPNRIYFIISIIFISTNVCRLTKTFLIGFSHKWKNS